MSLAFLTQNKPTVTVMIQSRTVSNAVNTIRNAVYDGADAFGLQICRLEPDERKNLTEIFRAAPGKPFYITNYRSGYNAGLSDDDCVSGLIDGLRAGGTLADVMGDVFDRSPDELTENKSAVD